jgi:superfamily I DNA/RNA helicase
MNFKPTPEQDAIVEAFLTTRDNILVNALAGAAKTTTLELVCKAIKGFPILSLAFNKRIAEEMTKRLPPHVSAMTINGLGHRAWQGRLKKRLTLNDSKIYEILKEEVNKLHKRDRDDAFTTFADTLQAIRVAKVQGYIPDEMFKDIKRPINRETFLAMFEDEPDIDLVDAVLLRSIKQAFDGTIDFNDQIYMPTLFGGDFPKYPLTLGDEAQDFSSLNIIFMQRLVGDRRFGAVGDRNQSIYAFRGAHSQSMSELQRIFNMREMTLSTSFRCPIEVVRLARKHTPNMQWAPWAKEGSVQYLDSWSQEDIPDGSVIICRHNAPLMKLAFRLLSQERGVKVIGTDLGPTLVRTLKKFGESSMTQAALIQQINIWEQAHLAKGKDSVIDKAECLRVFASFGPTLGAAVAYVERIFASGGNIQLTSGHKAKGLEWDTVFHLDPWRVPSKWAETDEDKQQENNLEYVITTRSKDKLFFINLEDMRDTKQ